MDRTPFASVVETHISVVLFLGDVAYKVKKPVALDFVDLTTREARSRLCHREVELNARLAPDVYLGVGHLVPPGSLEPEPMVVMRRMPDDRRLSVLVASGDRRAATGVAALAALLARFHRDAERSDVISRGGSAEAVAERWNRNFAEMRAHEGNGLRSDRIDEAERLSTAFLAGRRSLFEERRAAGHVCDGHGDIQADDVFCLDDGPRVLDCIEFDDRLRYTDVADDVAFLAMDLERLGAPDLADQFVAAYEDAVGEGFPPGLLHQAIAYRAQVRAKVASLRASQMEDGSDAAGLAGDLLELCIRHLTAAQVRCVVIGGLPGTGKSTLARRLGAELGADVVRSDVVRSALFPDVPPSGLRAGKYSSDSTDLVYAEMFRQAADALARGRSVILDASFSSEGHREVARRLAAETVSECLEIRCVLDREEAARRIRGRLATGNDVSEATPEIADAMGATADPWPTASEIDTGGSFDDAVVEALALAAGQNAGTRPVPSRSNATTHHRTSSPAFRPLR